MKRLWIAVLVLGCLSAARPPASHRDWKARPAVEQVPDFTGTLYVSGDVHGSLAEWTRLLVKAGVIEPAKRGFHWIAGPAIFVQLGDVIDKGDGSLSVIDLLLSLREEAEAAGGRVITVAGNHEMSFLADPTAEKTRKLRAEAERKGLDILTDVYAASSKYGAWFRALPAAALVHGIYMSHSGWAAGKSIEEIEGQFHHAMEGEEYDNPFTCGDHTASPATPGFFNANVWWGRHGEALDDQLARLGARQVIFGHDPHAFNAQGEMVGYFGDDDGRALIKADVGLVKGDSDGALFRCHEWRANGGCLSPEKIEGDGKRFVPLKILPRAPDAEEIPDARLEC